MNTRWQKGNAGGRSSKFKVQSSREGKRSGPMLPTVGLNPKPNPFGRSAGVPPAHDVLRPGAAGESVVFATPFGGHRQHPAERTITLCGRPERAGRPRSNCMVPASACRVFRWEESWAAERGLPSSLQPQRGCVLPPRVARNELPGVGSRRFFNPNGVAARCPCRAATPLGLWVCGPLSQGSSFLATLGWRPESRWDSALEFPHGIAPGPCALHLPLSFEL